MRNSKVMMTLTILVMMTIATLIFIISNVSSYFESKSEIKVLEKQIDQNNIEIEKIQKDIKYSETNEFVEKIARDKLGFIKVDEIVFYER